MKKILIAILALLMPLGLALTTSAPALAAGWTGQQCEGFNIGGQNAGRVCVQVHTVPTATGVRADQVQVCGYASGWADSQIRGTKSDGIFFQGSSGTWLGGFTLYSIPYQPRNAFNPSPVCVYTNISLAMGNGACYEESGTVNLNNVSDHTYDIRGKIVGGAC